MNAVRSDSNDFSVLDIRTCLLHDEHSSLDAR